MTRGSGSRAFWVLTGLAITFLIVFLVICVSMWGQLSALERQRQEVAKQKTELENELKQENRADLEADKAQLQARLGPVIGQDLSPGEYVPVLLRQLEQEAVLTGNDMVETRLGELRRDQVAGAAPAAAGAQPTPAADAGTPAAGGGAAAAGGAGEAAAPAAAPSGPRYHEQDLTLRLRGSYRSGFDFLKGLVQMPRLLNVREIGVRKSGNRLRADGAAEAEIQLEMTAYILEPTGGFPGRIVGDVVQ